MRGKFNKGGWKGGKTSTKTKQIDVTFFIIDDNKIGIQIPYGYCIQSIKNYIRDIGQGIWSYDDKCWIIKRDSYAQILQKIQDHFFKLNNEQDTNEKIIKVNIIEEFVFKAQEMLKQQLQEIKIVNLKPYNNMSIKYNSIQTHIDPESIPFYDKLFDFQKQSLKFGIHHHGRMLLADEMGVGKTIQSLAVAYIYKHEWPLLIICPPTLKINWQNQIKRWYPNIQPHQIQLINNAKTVFRVSVQIMIISYDLAWRMKDLFDHVKIVIADEAHYLKSADSKRSEILVPFLSTRKRVILLTGTPAFARPKQIYNLITIVRPGLFKNFKLFGNRYCDPKWNHWSHNYEYNGCKNVKQLHYILKGNIMIRRLKSQVLKQLPDKNRQKIVLETDASVVRNIKQVLEKNNINKMQTFFSQYINTANSVQSGGIDKRQQIMQAYRLSGIAKIKAIKQYIDQILQNGIKILVFAHHMKVMDQIQNQLKNKKHKFMRIDGSVSQVERANNVQKFQNDPQILVALLSITAAGVGITLTAASTVIFAELHWTPALMIQAEDRAHRVGQKDSVNCHYLIGQNTLDQMLYKFLEKKVLNVSSFVDGQSKDLQFEQLRKGQKGKFSKKDESFSSSLANNRSSHFGSGLMPQIASSRKKNYQQQSQQASQMTDITDISASTGGILGKGSRKRNPSSTLDNFVISKKDKKKRETQLKQIQSKQESNEYSQQEKYEVRRTTEFHDEYVCQSQQKVQQGMSSNIKRNKMNSNKSLDSDEQFDMVLQHYWKSKTQSNHNSQKDRQKQFDLNRSITKSIEKQVDNNSQRTQTVSNRSSNRTQQTQIQI